MAKQCSGGGGGPSQEEVDDILGAALDALDDLDDLDDGQPEVSEQDEDDVQTAAVAAATLEQPITAATQEKKKVYYGPEPPPGHPSTSKKVVSTPNKAAAPSAATSSLDDCMAQLIKAGEALQSGTGDGSDIDLDGAERMIDELMGQLQLGGPDSGDLGGASAPPVATAVASPTVGGTAASVTSAGSKARYENDTNSDKRRAKDTQPTPNASVEDKAKKILGTEDDVDRAVKRLLSDMAKARTDDEIPNINVTSSGGGGKPMEAMGEEMMEDMMKELSAFAASGDADDVMNGMMRQLLSKELMYEPMKQVNDRFPAWLADNKKSLSREEYEKFGTQYQYFQRIVHVYETDPENFPRLMELMQDIQEYGQPPADIIKELAPGLEFDEEGMPMDGQMPGMMPFAPGGEQCSIM